MDSEVGMNWQKKKKKKRKRGRGELIESGLLKK